MDAPANTPPRRFSRPHPRLRKAVKWAFTAVTVIAACLLGYGLFAIVTWRPLSADVRGFPVDGEFALLGAVLFFPSALLANLLWRGDRKAEARRRILAGLCPACGYNRAGLSAPNTLCPECGAAAPTT